MDTNKLFKAIQIIVQEEVKKEISLIKEEIRKEVLAEIKKSQPVKQQSSLKSLVEESADPFDLADKILNHLFLPIKACAVINIRCFCISLGHLL